MYIYIYIYVYIYIYIYIYIYVCVFIYHADQLVDLCYLKCIARIRRRVYCVYKYI